MQAFFASFDNTETSKIYQKKVTRAASSPSPSVRFAHCHLSQRERPWQRDEVCVDCQGLPLWGSWHRAAMTERASPLKLFAAAVPLYDPSRENGIPERPQTLRYSEIKNNISLAYAQSNAERIQNRPAQQKSRRTKVQRLCGVSPHSQRSAMIHHIPGRLIRPSRCSNTISMVFSFQTVRFSRTAPLAKTEAAS